MSNNKVKTRLVYRVDAFEDFYVTDSDSRKYKFNEATYNEQGNVLTETEFDADGNVVYYVLNVYNEKGLLNELERFYYGTLTEKCVFTYTSDDLPLTEKIIYTGAGEKETTYTYTDFKKPATKITIDHSHEDPTLKEKFEYHNERLTKRSIYQNDDEEPCYWRAITYDQTLADKIMEETVFDASTGITTVITSHVNLSYLDNKLAERITRTFDEKEKLIQELTEDAKGKRIVTYQYDAEGNIVMEERHRQGAIYFKVASEYNEAGLLVKQTVIDTANGSYTEFYDYDFYS
jgi:hypothetical protein